MSEAGRLKRVSGTLLVVLATISASGVTQKRPVELQGDTANTEATGKLGRKAHAELQDRAAHGWSGAVVIEHRGRVVLRSGYGWANPEHTIPFTTRTVAQIGSLTKQFTAAAIVDLERKGKLRFSDSLATHLPGVVGPARSITLHELLTHTSGLGEYCGRDLDRAPLDDFVARCLNAEPRLESRGSFVYSNPGYSVLGAVVERVSGQPLEEFVEAHLLARVGMGRTGYEFPGLGTDSMATCYAAGRPQPPIATRLAPLEGAFWNLKGNGGMQASAEDMYRWYRALQDPSTIPSESRVIMMSAQVQREPGVGYGYGWNVRTGAVGEVQQVSHAGSDGACAAAFVWRPQDDLFIYIVGNAERETFDAARALLRLARNGDTTPNPTSDPLTYTWHEIAPGVWTGIRENSPRFPVMGTTTFVVGAAGVVVFDGGGLPLMSERAIETIRSVTDRPVTHVAISHWHQDHNFGIRAFADAFPGVQIISHPYTRATLIRANSDSTGALRETIHTVIERNIPGVREALASGETAGRSRLSAGDEARLRQLLADAEMLDREYRRIDPVYPTVTFEDRLVIHQGDREIHLLHLGRGNTAGDIVLWLPAERIVATGDLVVRPTPYGFGSYPREWAETLRRLKELGFTTLVPGHGDIQRDARYVDLLIETLELVADQMEALVAAGVPEEAAVERLDFSSVEHRFTAGDDFLASRFNVWFKQPVARAAYRIATGEPPENIQ